MPSAPPPVSLVEKPTSQLVRQVGEALARAIAHQRAMRIPEAILAYDEVLEIAPDRADALINRGVLERLRGRSDEAVAFYLRALATGENSATLWLNYANALIDLNRLPEARTAVGLALSRGPKMAEAWMAAANLLLRQDKHIAAEVCLGRALKLAPANAALAVRLASLYSQQGLLDEAQAMFATARELGPLTPSAHSGYGQTLISQGRLDEAERHLRRALELDADQLDAHLGLARLLLLQGELGSGWVEYEWRRKKPESKLPKLPGKEWDGSSIKGKKLLVYAEQGFGDVIQFVRYVPILAKMGAIVTLVVPPQLLRLLTGFPGAIAVLSSLRGDHQFDFHVPLLTVPKLTGISIDSLPAAIPYLQPPQSPSLPAPLGTRLKVGLVWAGSPKHVNDRHRSLDLELLLRFAGIHGVTLYSLQAGPRAGDLTKYAHPVLVRDLSPYLRDFTDTAGVIAQLDLVITVDTAIAHLAGALGKPVWVLTPLAPDWRWLLDRDDTPWYPTMRLYRQSRSRDWDDVVERIEADLSVLAASRPPFLGSPQLDVLSIFPGADGNPRFSMPIPRPFLQDVGVRFLALHERSGEGYEYATRCFIDAHLSPGDVFVDVGAHWGIMSLQAATRWPGQVRVLACEPLALNVTQLKRWIEHNGLTQEIEPVAVAIADAAGKGELRPESTMGHSLIKQDEGRIEVTSVDLLLSERPALASGRVMVKIDVEGSESSVIAGMRTLLDSGRVSAVIWEKGPSYVGEDGRKAVLGLRQRFSELGFTAWRFDSEKGAGPLIPFVDADGWSGNVFELAPGLAPLPSYGSVRPPPPKQPDDPWLDAFLKALDAYHEGARLQSADKIDRALKAYAGVSLLDLGNPDLFNNLGVALRSSGRLAAAEAAYRRSLALRPRSAGVLSNLGNVLREQGKLTESEKVHKAAIDLSPDESRLHYNFGLLLRDDGRPKESRAEFERTLRLDPKNDECRWDWALSLLQDGDYAQGLPAYEARWKLERCPERHVPLTRWTGEPLKGRSLFLHDEQGFGDVLQWARFIPEAKKRGAGRIVLECQPELMRLMSMAPGVDAVIGRGEATPDCDFYAPLLSLPGMFGVTLETLPNKTPYLSAPEPALPLPLPDDGRIKLGLVWAGKPTPRDRSCSLELLLPLLDDPAIVPFSLQVGPRAGELKAMGGDMVVTDLGPRLVDFAETAAVMSKMDIIVTVDTSVAHLAAALGVPTYMLLLYTSDWRWFDKGTASPWYPSMRLFRQTVPFQWDEPVKELKAALQDLVARKKTG